MLIKRFRPHQIFANRLAQGRHLCMACEHIATNPSRRAVIQIDPIPPAGRWPGMETYNWTVVLCDDGDHPCSAHEPGVDGILTLCSTHMGDVLSRPMWWDPCSRIWREFPSHLGLQPIRVHPCHPR